MFKWLRIPAMPDMRAWRTHWKFTPQPDITVLEIATILAHVGGYGLSDVAIKDDDPTFAPVKRHFTQID